MIYPPGPKPLLIGVVQPPALPGSPAWAGKSLDDAMEHMVSETTVLLDNGMDGVIVQNMWDGPTSGPALPHTIAAMAVVVRAVRAVCPGPLGVNLNANDGPATLAVAAAAGADFVRIKVLVGVMIKSDGLTVGCAAPLAAARRLPGMPPVQVIADVHDRSGVPLGGVSLAGDVDGALWSGADGVIITGPTMTQTVAMLDEVKGATGTTPLWVAGGTNETNLAQILGQVKGIIVGASVRVDGDEWALTDPARVRRYVAAASI